jgi:Putative phage tail protein/Domain of unknown function (DUF1983)
MPYDHDAAEAVLRDANVRKPEKKRNIRRIASRKLKEIQGSGGGKGKSPRVAQEDPNTLIAKQTARVIDLLSEGEIEGLVEGWGSIFLDGTALESATGGRNFSGVIPDFRYGLADQAHYPGFPAAEQTVAVSVEVLNGTPVVRTISDAAIDAARISIQIPALYKQDKTNGDMHGFEVHFTIDVRPSGGLWANVIDKTIKGKTTSSYVEDFRIELDGAAPWEIRVSRVSPADADSSMQSKIFWSHYTAITDGKFIYPSCASAALMVDAQQFGTNIPNRTYEIRGIKVKYPSNMDPLTRTFTGLWNGTFSYGYCNDPVWVLYDVLTRKSRGRGRLVEESRVDKWSFYVASQYASQIVPDGYGSDEFRFSFNGVISQQEEAYHVLQSIASNFRGILYWASGSVFVRCDMPEAPVKLVTPANVIDQDGVLFTYAGSGSRARHTVAMVTYSNPLDAYQSAIEMVEMPEAIARYGWNPIEITATGCTSRGQAYRLGRWVLDTEQNETETISYQASMDHADLSPGDIISVADPDYANVRMGGRIAAVNVATKQITLDGPVTLVAGQTYTLSVTRTDGTLQDMPVTNAAGTHTILTTTAVPATEQGAIWVVTGTDVAPRKFRVMSIRETELNIYEIVGLFHDPTKYARVEFGVSLDPPPYARPENQSDPVSNITFTEESVMESESVSRNLRVAWTPPGNPNVALYRIRWRRNFGEYTNPITVYVPEYVIPNVLTGTYEVLVTASSAFGHESIPTAASYEVALGGTSLFAAVANVRIKGGGTTFTGRDAVIEWDASPATQNGAVLRDYHVTIKDATTNLVVRTAIATVNGFTYFFDMNVSDGGPRRTFKVEVRVRDTFDRLSNPGTATVSNPTPALPTGVTFTGGFRFITMKFTRPTDPDYAGVQVWMSTTSGFTPAAGNLAADGADTPLVIQGLTGTTYYVRYAAYDDFGKTGLTVSGELSVATVRIDHTELVTETLRETNLYPALQSRINAIDASGTGLIDKVAALTTNLAGTDAAIVTETNTRISEDTALGTRIDAVVAQASGFNAVVNYTFNTALEGWTATGGALALQTNGTARITSSGTDPVLLSPTGLTISGAQNRYIRAKVTRIAGSGWDGKAFYVTSGHSFASTHYKGLNNPNLAVGASTVINFDMHALTAGGTDWQTSTITAFRLDLGATAADIFEVDWIAVGTDGPPAGTAAVIAAVDAAASATSAQASRIDTLYARVAQLQYREIFDGDLTLFNTNWTSLSGTGEISIAAVGQTGPNALRVGNNSGADMAWIYGDSNIPFDPTRLYKITFRVQRTAGTGTFYGGFAGYAADGTTLVGQAAGASGVTAAQHWVAAVAAAPGATWTTYTGYLKGYSAVGVAGTANVRSDPTQPGTLWSTVEFIRPVMILNYNGATGTMEVDSVVIEYADTEAALQVQATTSATRDGALEAQWTVKTDVAGHVAGFGLASTLRDGVPHSAFIVNADKFAIAKPGANPLNPTIPFIIDTSKTPAVMSFAGYASIDMLTTGHLETEMMFVGPNANTASTPYVVLDGVQSNIRVNNGTRDVVKLGKRADNSYGIEILDNAGNTILSSASGLGNGVVKFDSMAAGTGTNLMYNADMNQNLHGWFTGYNDTGLTQTLYRNLDANNTIPGVGTIAAVISGTPVAGKIYDFFNSGQATRYPVVAGRRYEFSAYMALFRATGCQLNAQWVNSAGGVVSESFTALTGPISPGGLLSNMNRHVMFATAPAGAVSVQLAFRTYCVGGAGGNGPTTVVCQPFIGEAGANQSEPSRWSPGPTPVSAGGVTGLGTLATQNSVNWNTHITNIPGFQQYAFLSTITSANIGTYIQSAAIGDAYISNLAATKLRAGFIDVHDIVVRLGSIRVIDSNNANRDRVWIGHRPQVDYGFWLWNSAGQDIFNSSGLNGTFIRDATIGTLKLGNEVVMIPRSATNKVAGVGNGAFQQVINFNITLAQPARLIFIVSLSQSFPGGNRNWTVRGQIYLSDGTAPMVDRWGGAWNDAISLSGDVIAPAGTHSCVVWWRAADNTVKFNEANMIVMGAMR